MGRQAVREIDVAKAKTHLSALLKAIEQDGETVVITRNGHAVARLGPADAAEGSPRPRKLSGMDLVQHLQALREPVAQANSSTDEPPGKT
ncbi:hypothetical protein ASD47_07150 [Caulobacter sp. Root1472]|jgi:prevent-host-death family protein|nr:hypothetical protein ASD47_07150 [Caulobacter sp. Root1472]